MYGQIHGAYSDGQQFHVFTSDGEYHIFDFDREESFSGSYEVSQGVIYFYNNRGRFTTAYYISGSRNALLLKGNDGAWRLKYTSTPEDFLAASLIGLGIQALFDN